MNPEGLSDEERSAHLHNALAVEELIAANSESNRTMATLVEKVREETAARDRKVDALEKGHRQARIVIVLVAVLVVFLIAIGVINAINLGSARKSQKQTADIAASVDRTNQTLLDCVNSTGACGQVNQANQARILDTVKLYELTVLYCARTNPRDVDSKGTKFLKCVNDLYPGGPQLNPGAE